MSGAVLESESRWLHPAVWQLYRFQSVSRWMQIGNVLRDPRRRALSILALLLATVWLSQAVLSILLRQSGDPQQLRVWMMLGLFGYSLFHVIKTVNRGDEEPLDWTPAEREWLLAAPLTRQQALSFRWLAIGGAAVLKATCFCLLMIPDLPNWPVAWVTVALVLIQVDLFRVGGELFFHGLGAGLRRIVQVVTLAAAGGLLLVAVVRAIGAAAEADGLSSPAGLAIWGQLLADAERLFSQPLAGVLLGPYTWAAEAIFGVATPLGTGFRLLGVLAAVASSLAIVLRLDRWTQEQVRQRARQRLTANGELRLPGSATGSEGRNARRRTAWRFVPWRLRGVGPLAWRQALGAWNYRSTIVMALLVPGFLSCLPLLAGHPPGTMILQVSGSLLFYSFLLLPPALMLDFRRDLNRMVLLKSLPISAVSVTLGQLAVPTLIATLFQCFVLAAVAISGQVVGWHAVLAAIILCPLNALIFAVENAIFLISPYQRNREGVDVLLRTVLTFTAKGILFGIAVGLILLWAVVVRHSVELFHWPSDVSPWVFGGGLWLGTLVLTRWLIRLIANRFDELDPSQDLASVN